MLENTNPVLGKEMLSKISKSISGVFLGKPVAETEEIYQTADGKFRIRFGPFRTHEDDILWLKFVHKSLMTNSSSGIGIHVDSYQHFADFLGVAVDSEVRVTEVPRRLPIFGRVLLAINEGISHSALRGEYKSRTAPEVVIRFFPFKNRRPERRVVCEHKTSGGGTYEVMDDEVLSLIQHEIKIRQCRFGWR